MTEFISIRGARENNLKDVTLDIPKRKLTISSSSSPAVCVMDELGPGGGNKGGEVVFEGTPSALVKARGSLTGQYLR